MTKVKQTDVEHIAHLARLLLRPKEVEKFSHELSTILAFVEKLNVVDTADVPPTRQVTERVNGTREDVVYEQSSTVQDALRAAAPDLSGRGFRVPGVFGEE